MAKAGDKFIVELKETHLGWGTYRYTNSRDIISGEGYIPIPSQYAKLYQLYNSNKTNGLDILGENIFNFVTDDGFLSGQLKSQGCNDGGAVFAKQFSVNDDLKALGTWYAYVNMQVGDKVEVQFTTPTDIIIRKI